MFDRFLMLVDKAIDIAALLGTLGYFLCILGLILIVTRLLSGT